MGIISSPDRAALEHGDLEDLLPPSSSAESATSPSIPPAMFAALACGILQGSLHALGVHCVVSADLQKLPACTFTLRISE